MLLTEKKKINKLKPTSIPSFLRSAFPPYQI